MTSKKEMLRLKRERHKLTKTYLYKLQRKNRTKADNEWKLAVRKAHDNKSAISGETKNLNAHHILPKENFPQYRHDLMNGILLSPKEHKLGKFSAHKNPIWFVEMLK